MRVTRSEVEARMACNIIMFSSSAPLAAKVSWYYFQSSLLHVRVKFHLAKKKFERVQFSLNRANLRFDSESWVMIKFGLMEERSELSIGAAEKLGHFSTFCHTFMLSELFAFAVRCARGDIQTINQRFGLRFAIDSCLFRLRFFGVGTFLYLLNP